MLPSSSCASSSAFALSHGNRITGLAVRYTQRTVKHLSSLRSLNHVVRRLSQHSELRRQQQQCLALSEHEERESSSLEGSHLSEPDSSSEVEGAGQYWEPVSEEEAKANERRRLESLELRGETDEDEDEDPFVGLNDWRWTLNWNEITSSVFVGACPRKPRDVDAIKKGTGCTAILCLQSHGCFEALGIDHPKICERGANIGVKVIHVPIRDFDHGSQAEMIPEAVRVLNLLLKTGHKVYVHCTAGINRATLTVVSYLTFVEGWSLNDAHDLVKERRPQAHPYLDCWWTARSRFLQGRSEQISARSQKIYEERCYACEAGTTGEDWFKAERDLICEMYENRLVCDTNIVGSWNATNNSGLKRLEIDLENEKQKCQSLASKLQSSSFLQSELEATRMEVNTLKEDLSIVSHKLRMLQKKEEELDQLKIQLKEEKDQVESLNREIDPLKKNLNAASRELQRKKKLELEMVHANKQMSAMKSAFEVLHTNLNRSCDTITTSGKTMREGETSKVEVDQKEPRTNGHGVHLPYEGNNNKENSNSINNIRRNGTSLS